MKVITEAHITSATVALVRLDLNLPLDSSGQVTDGLRFEKSLPTINFLLNKNAKTVLISHFQRPKGQYITAMSLKCLVNFIAEKTGREVILLDCLDNPKQLLQKICNTPQTSIVLLENLRFSPGEESNDEHFAQMLASLGNIYVNDALSCSHRTHASIVGITNYLESYAGLHLHSELYALNAALVHATPPKTAIIGGKKISTKINAIKGLLPYMDNILIGGAMANTFLAAQGHDIGQSFYEPEMINAANEIIYLAARQGSSSCKLVLPTDVTGIVDDAIFTANIQDIDQKAVIYDIGPETIRCFNALLAESSSVIYNGPMGMYELPTFSTGTVEMAKQLACLTKHQGTVSIIGGGDTLGALRQNHIDFSSYTYISTAGGALLEWLEGKRLPGLQALQYYN